MPDTAQDETAIQRVINTYSQYASKGDWDRVLPLFLPEAVWQIPHLGMKLEGKDAIAATLAMFKGTMDYVLQLNSPALIEIDGDSARATSGIRESGKSAGKDEALNYFGIYADEFTRTADGWKFRTRVFEGIGSQTYALLTGTAH
ncbi:MAG: nuclear transport factor 2 family protein [Novosphingobium sp.]